MLISWLKRPYYYSSSTKFRFITSFGFGFFVWFFLYFFKPFKINNLNNNLFFYTLGFGLITLGVLLFAFFILQSVFKGYFNKEKWTIGKHLFFVFGLTFITGLLNWYYNNLVQDTSTIALVPFLALITYTLSIGFMPIIIVVFIEELLYRKKREKVAQSINDVYEEEPTIKVKTIITITTANKNDFLQVNLTDLLYINSEGNYACFFILNNKEVKEHILRASLQSVYNQLEKYNNMIRCHKSYIVNTRHINKISGNARGYLLHSSKFDFIIPVSRMFSKEKLKNLLN